MISVYGKTENDHGDRLVAVLDRIKTIGLKLNRANMQMKHAWLVDIYMRFIIPQTVLMVSPLIVKQVNLFSHEVD